MSNRSKTSQFGFHKFTARGEIRQIGFYPGGPSIRTTLDRAPLKYCD